MDKIILEELNRVREIMGLKKPLIIDKPKITNLREDRGTGAVNLIKRLFMGADNLLKKEVKDKDFIKNILSDEIDEADKLIQSAGLEDELEQAVLKGSDEVDKVIAKIAGLSDNTKILKLLIQELAPGATELLEKFSKAIDDFVTKNKSVPETMIDEYGELIRTRMKGLKTPDGERLYDDNFIDDVVNQFKASNKSKHAGKISSKTISEKFAFLAESLNFLRIHLKYVWRSRENLRKIIENELIPEINAAVGNNELIRVKSMELAQAVQNLKKWDDKDLQSFWDIYITNNPKLSDAAKKKLQDEFEKNTVVQTMLNAEAQNTLKNYWSPFAKQIGAKLELIPIIRVIGLSLQGRGKDFSIWKKLLPLELDRFVNYVLWRDARSVNEIAELMVQKGTYKSKLTNIASGILANYIFIPFVNGVIEMWSDNLFLLALKEKERLQNVESLKTFCDLAKQKDPNFKGCDKFNFEELKKLEDETGKDVWDYMKENFPIWGPNSEAPPSGYLGLKNGWAILAKDALGFTYVDEVINGIRYIISKEAFTDADDFMAKVTKMAGDKAEDLLKQSGFDPSKSMEQNIEILRNELETVTTPEPAPTEKTYTADEDGFKKFCEDATDQNDKDNTGYEFLEGMIEPETGTYYGKAKSRADQQTYEFKSVVKDGKVSFEPN